MKTEYKRKKSPLITLLIAGVASLLTFAQFEIIHHLNQHFVATVFLINGFLFNLGAILYVLKTPSINLDTTQIHINYFFTQKIIDYKNIDSVDLNVKGKIKLNLKDQTQFEFWSTAIPNDERTAFAKDLLEKITQLKS